VARGGVAAANRLAAGMERAGFSAAPGIHSYPVRSNPVEVGTQGISSFSLNE
jgi:hypothetical protein